MSLFSSIDLASSSVIVPLTIANSTAFVEALVAIDISSLSLVALDSNFILAISSSRAFCLSSYSVLRSLRAFILSSV